MAEPSAILSILVRAQGIARTEAQLKKLNASTESSATSTDKLERRFSHLDNTLGDFNRTVMAAENAVKILKFPAMITAAGAATNVIGALGAGVVGLTSALGPLSGALAGAGAGALALGQGMIVGKLATQNLGKALGGNKKALAALTPAQRDFIGQLKEAKKHLGGLQNAAAQGLLPGLGRALKTLTPVFKVLEPVVRSTGKAIGQLAAMGARMVKGWGGDLTRIGNQNVSVLKAIGFAVLRLVDAFKNVMIAAGPLIKWFEHLIVAGARFIDVQTKAGRASGKMAEFFRQTRDVMTVLGGILKNLGGAFGSIFKAAMPLGRQMLNDFLKLTKQFNEWTKSVGGHNSIVQYFKDAKGPLYATLGLLGDLVKAFFQLSGKGNKQTTALINKLREVVPVIEEVLASTTAALGPALVDMLVNVIKLFGQLAGSSGPLVITVKLLGFLAGTLASLLSHEPGLAVMIVTVTGLAGAFKILKVVTAPISASLKLIESGLWGVKGAAENAEKYTIRERIQLGLMRAQEILSAAATKAWLVVTKAATAATYVMSGALAIFNAVMDANPIILVIAGLVALGAAFYLAYKKIQPFHDAVNAAWDILKSVFQWIATNWKLVVLLVGGPLGVMALLVIKHFNTIKTATIAVFNFIKGFIVGTFNAIRSVVEPIVKLWVTVLTAEFNVLKAVVKTIFGALEPIIVGVFNAIKTAVGAVLGAMVKLVSGAASGLGKAATALANAFANPIKAIFSGVVDVIKGFISTIIGVINTFFDLLGIKKIGDPFKAAPKPVSGSTTLRPPAGGQSARPRAAGAYKEGGRVDAPVAIMGEEAPRHPEWVIPTNPAYRNRAVSLWAKAAHDIGVPGFQLGGLLDKLNPAKAATFVAGLPGKAVHTVAGVANGLLDKLPANPIKGPLKGIGTFILDKVGSALKHAASSIFKSSGDYGPSGSKGPRGVGVFKGIPMADWVIDSLRYAESKGVAVIPTSGFRPGFDPHTATGTSEHQGLQYPHGAVDFGGYHDQNAKMMKMAVVGATAGYKYPLLAPKGFIDDGHASGTGHRKGGLLRRFQKGGSHGGPTASAASHYGLQALRRLWVKGGGDPHYATLMAHVAQEESGGESSRVNSIGATGLWQIHPGGSQYLSPLANARAAVRKFNASRRAGTSAGGVRGLAPWADSLNKGAGSGWSRWAKARDNANTVKGLKKLKLPGKKLVKPHGLSRQQQRSSGKGAAKQNLKKVITGKPTAVKRAASNYEDFYGAALTVAQETPDLNDDMRVLVAWMAYEQARYAKAKKTGNASEIIAAQAAIDSIKTIDFQKYQEAGSAVQAHFTAGDYDAAAAAAGITPGQYATQQLHNVAGWAQAGGFGLMNPADTGTVASDFTTTGAAGADTVSGAAAAADPQALANAILELAAQVKAQNDFATSVAGITSREAIKAMADVISGQIVGIGYSGRALTASAGQTVRY